MFQIAKRYGARCLESEHFLQRCKSYVYDGFQCMGTKLDKADLKLGFYESESVIIALVPDGVFTRCGKLGRSFSMRKVNIICMEEGLFANDCVKWTEHEVGHVISWRDYRDKPMISSPFLTGGRKYPFRPLDVLGHTLYPNVWSEYIPFTRQMRSLSNDFSLEVMVEMIMQDYYLLHNEVNKLGIYRRVLVGFANCALEDTVPR
jgi:hypothetical protein